MQGGSTTRVLVDTADAQQRMASRCATTQIYAPVSLVKRVATALVTSLQSRAWTETLVSTIAVSAAAYS